MKWQLCRQVCDKETLRNAAKYDSNSARQSSILLQCADVRLATSFKVHLGL